MSKTEIQKLQDYIDKLKLNYEEAKQERIELVDNINILDEKLDKLTEEKTKVKENNNVQERNKKLLKRGITYSIFCTLISLAVIFLIDALIFRKFINVAFKIISAIIINTTANMTPYFYFKNNNSFKIRTIEDVEKEYKETLEKRLSEGSKYNSVRKKEATSEIIYKKISEVLNEKTNYIENNNDKLTSIETRDIYSAIKLDPSFLCEPIEEKRRILDEELKKYLLGKVSEIYNNEISTEDLESFTTKELFNQLTILIPENQHQEKLSNIIHAILNFSAELQGYSVVWFEEKEETYINNPEIIFDQENRWSELKTHKSTSYITIFDIVYDTFTNKVMKENNAKRRTRKK